MSERGRTFEWHPMVGAMQGRAMSGLAYITAMRDGVVSPPPIIDLRHR